LAGVGGDATATTGFRGSGTVTAAPDPTAFVTVTTFLGTTEMGTETLAGVFAAPGEFAGTVMDAPQEHFPFLPAISGFQRNVLPHETQGNLMSIACSMIRGPMRWNTDDFGDRLPPPIPYEMIRTVG
jgi:hypothetical protein